MITVRFSDGTDYRYTYASAGREQVEQMKRFARAGRGLSSFIAQHVREGYAGKVTSARQAPSARG